MYIFFLIKHTRDEGAQVVLWCNNIFSLSKHLKLAQQEHNKSR